MTNASALPALTAAELAPLFWRPSRLGVESAWYGHVPFAHWLVAAHRPRSIVELGTHNGVSYAAFCEAVLREGLDTRCLAIDSWQGDEHAGFYGESVLAELRRFHDERYAGFSTLHQSLFAEALPVVPDGSIDLLHIDGRHRYEDALEDFTEWRGKLSARGVVLFHDTNVRRGDFGVWRLWAELAAGHPHFEFLHAHGLGVLAVGSAVDGAVAALCGDLPATERSALRDRFALLGERWAQARELAEQQAAAARLAEDLARTREWADRAQGEVNKLFPQHRDLLDNHRVARNNLAQARYELAAREQEVETLRGDLAALRDELSATRRQLDRATAEADAARATAAGHVRTIEADRQQFLAEYERLRLEYQRLGDAAEARLAEAEARFALIVGSSSWRLTAPLRGVLGLLRGTPPAPAEPPRALPAPVEQPAAPAIAEMPPAGEPEPEAQEPPAEIGAPSPWGDTTRPRILFISGEDHTPGTVYRVERYVEAARACGFAARWMTAGPVGPADLEQVAITVLWRVPHSGHIQGIVQVTREQGGLAIFDVDDLMFRPELAVIDIIDGIRSQKFSELDTQAFFARIGRTLKACDLVTCPTEELARHARRMGRPAYVLPNGFDAQSHAAARRARREWALFGDDLLRIGYAAGSRTHQRDFAVAAPAVLRILRENDRARLTLFRDGSSGEGVVLLNEFPEFAEVADRIEWRNMVPLAELPGELARFAINIAPLEDGNPFCEAKSELKYFEAALVGVPTIASPSGPFRRAIIPGVTGMLARTEAEWHAALTTLLADADLRVRIAQAAYHDSLAHFGPEARAESFALMVAQARGGAAGAAAFERERHRAALPRLQPPHVPASTVLFSADRMRRARVTVIVPVYKYADYVTEALASIAAQTLDPIDLVVIDDASPDDSSDMVLSWMRAHEGRFNRIRLLRHVANAGLGFARNSGFADAETEFVLPLDADNRLRPEACAQLLAALEASGAAFAYPAIRQFGDKSDVFGTTPYSVLRLACGNYIDAMALVRKSAWAGAGGYDHVRYGWEDFDFWCRLAERGQYGINVPDVLADYRVHAASMLHTMTEVRDHKNDLVDDLTRRHPWLDVPRKDEVV